MLERFQPVPPDPILGLGQLFAADTRDSKIDLGVGVFKDASGNTPIMSAVKKAEKILRKPDHEDLQDLRRRAVWRQHAPVCSG